LVSYSVANRAGNAQPGMARLPVGVEAPDAHSYELQTVDEGE